MAQSLQARPDKVRQLTAEDFRDNGETAVYWLTGSGVMVNVHGTILLFDPVLGYKESKPLISENFHVLLNPTPIQPDQLPRCDAVFYTHMDFDHFSEPTIQGLQWTVSPDFYVPNELMWRMMRFYGVRPLDRHLLAVGESVRAGSAIIKRTPALHDWQTLMPDHYDWAYAPEDCTGYRVETPDGVVWITGDTKLLPEHLAMTDVDVVFLDYSRSESHFTEEGAIRLSNALSQAQLVPYHWGTYDEPQQAEFNGDPQLVRSKVIPPERLLVLDPGEKLVLNKRKRDMER